MLEAQVASGLSVSEYARQIGVSAPTLYQWRRRLAEQATARRSEGECAARLVEVVLGGELRRIEPERCLVVRLGRDRRVEVPPGFDSDDLRRLVAVLESC